MLKTRGIRPFSHGARSPPLTPSLNDGWWPLITNVSPPNKQQHRAPRRRACRSCWEDTAAPNHQAELSKTKRRRWGNKWFCEVSVGNSLRHLTYLAQRAHSTHPGNATEASWWGFPCISIVVACTNKHSGHHPPRRELDAVVGMPKAGVSQWPAKQLPAKKTLIWSCKRTHVSMDQETEPKTHDQVTYSLVEQIALTMSLHLHACMNNKKLTHWKTCTTTANRTFPELSRRATAVEAARDSDSDCIRMMVWKIHDLLLC